LFILGTCEPEEFTKALEKIGLQLPSKAEVTKLFNHYDSDGSGSLDYKEFTLILLGGSNVVNADD
jgi:Ca2+-binding EF-hand superfamily protein